MAVAPFRMLGKRDEELGPSTARRPRTWLGVGIGLRVRVRVRVRVSVRVRVIGLRLGLGLACVTHPPSDHGARPRAAVRTARLRTGAARLHRALQQSVRRPPTTAKVVVRPGGASRDRVRVRARVAVGSSVASPVLRVRVRVRVLPYS